MDKEDENKRTGRTTLTNPTPVKVRRSGTSDVLGIPAAWIKAIPGLKCNPLLFEAVIQRDGLGNLYIQFRKVTPDEFNQLKH
jgi:hypothetical protein